MLRFLLDAQTITLLIKLSHTISLWITYTMTENGCLVVLLCIYYSLMQHLVQTCAIEDIITQYKASRIITDELLTDYEGLCQAIR